MVLVGVLALALARGFLAVAEIVFVLFDFAFDARLALIGVSLLTSGLLSKMVAAAAMPISFSILARCFAKKTSGSSPSFSMAANSCSIIAVAIGLFTSLGKALINSRPVVVALMFLPVR